MFNLVTFCGAPKVCWATAFAMMCAPAWGQETKMTLTPNWEYVADTVMGGVSTGQINTDTYATRLTGTVSLDNNGGFVQMAFDTDGIDPAAWQGIAFEVQGNGEVYEMRLRTDQLTRPWQSYRVEFTAPVAWKTQRLPFKAFSAHRTTETLDLTLLRRIGVLAIGRAFTADIAVANIRLYR